jgi:hypothetical protein
MVSLVARSDDIARRWHNLDLPKNQQCISHAGSFRLSWQDFAGTTTSSCGALTGHFDFKHGRPLFSRNKRVIIPNVVRYTVEHRFVIDPLANNKQPSKVDPRDHMPVFRRYTRNPIGVPDGRSAIVVTQPKTGKTERRRDMPSQYFGEGIVDWGPNLIEWTWQSHVGFVLDRFSLKIVRQFHYDGEGWGMTRTANELITSDAQPIFAERLKSIEVALHNRDNREHDIFDSDDYFQFHGGMIASIRALTGAQPKAYFRDSSRPESAQVRDLREEALRVYRSRVVNPKWIESIKRHGYKGGLELAATVDYIFGFDATAQIAPDFVYEGLAEHYAWFHCEVCCPHS